MRIQFLALLYLYLQSDEVISQNSSVRRINQMLRENPPEHGVRGITGMSGLTKIVNQLREAGLIDNQGHQPTDNGKLFLQEIESTHPYWYDEILSVEYEPESKKVLNATIKIIQK